MAETSSPDKIVLDPSEDDVCMGRGNAVNFRRGNANFRQLAREKATSYGEASTNDKTTKDDIATNMVNEIKRRGGRFLRAISATGADGTVVAVWEIVDDETAIAKAKQTLRDSVAAIRKEMAERFAARNTSGGSWPQEHGPVVPGRRMSFQTMAEQQRGLQAHFAEPYWHLAGGPGSFNTMAFDVNSSVSHDLANLGSRDSMLMSYLGPALFPPIDVRQVRPTIQPLTEEWKGRHDGILQQLQAMGRLSSETTSAETTRSAIAASTMPLTPSDFALLESLHRLQQEGLLRRRFLLSQLSDDAMRQFIASEGGFLNLGDTSRRNSAPCRQEERPIPPLGHVPFGILRPGDYATPSETRLTQDISACQEAAAFAAEQSHQRRMQSATLGPAAVSGQKKAESSSSSSANEPDNDGDATDEDRDGSTGINTKPPPKKRHRTYKRDDDDESN
jgi:hypothetical protein